MYSPELPTSRDIFRLIEQHGEPFAEVGEQRVSIPGLEYDEGKTVEVDPRVIAASGIVYANGSRLTDALYMHGAKTVLPLEKAYDYVAGHLSRPTEESLVIGTSGFATAVSSGYKDEAALLYTMYDYADRTRANLALSIDGASRPGILGLNVAAANLHNIPTLGYIPLKGLADMLPHDHLVISGNKYKQRQAHVGTTPDLLTVYGGRGGTLSECEAAIKAGGVVLQCNARVYGSEDLPNTYQQSDILREAVEKQQFIIHNPEDDMDETFGFAIGRAIELAEENRPARRTALAGLLDVA